MAGAGGYPPALETALESVDASPGQAPLLQPPQVPLCQRVPEHTAQLASLLSWHEQALAAVRAVGDTWAREEGGPSQADLETELSWLLDDAVAGLITAVGDARQVSWRWIERGLRSKEQEQQLQQEVQLRAPLQALDDLWQQRLHLRAPLQYLTTSAHWRDLVLSVGPGILIPRPETEQMVDFVAEAVAGNPALALAPWADLGTGSGALAIALARQLPAVPWVWAVDLSPTPVAYATFNSQRLGVADRVRVVQGSWYEPLQQAGAGRLGGIVSNPPYVTAQQMPGLQAEVGRHEPHLALDGGAGLGIDALVPICTGAVTWLQPGGFLALETGGGEQAHYVADLLRHLRDYQQQQQQWQGSSGEGSDTGLGNENIGVSTSRSSSTGGEDELAFTDVRVRTDFFGVERFVTATRSGL
ncbi:hypothetical protein N2152v2_004998 [Parachlorella kessleri]